MLIRRVTFVTWKNLRANTGGGLPFAGSPAYLGLDRGLLMAMDSGEIVRLIKAGIPDAEVTIRDIAGDGDHYAATVISPSFKGK